MLKTDVNCWNYFVGKFGSRLSQSQNTLKEFATHLLGLDAPAIDSGFGFVISPCSSKAVSHSSTIQAKFWLTSVFEWELVFPALYGPLAYFGKS